MAAAHVPIDRVFHALANPSRLSIMERLGRGPVPVSALAEGLKITLAAIVQHLQILEETGLARTEKHGRTRICRIEHRGLATAENWIAERRATWERRYEKLEDLLREETLQTSEPRRHGGKRRQ